MDNKNVAATQEQLNEAGTKQADTVLPAPAAAALLLTREQIEVIQSAFTQYMAGLIVNGEIV